MKEILRTDRLVLREMCEDDLAALTEILGDEKTMYAYEHAFSASEIRAWLDNQYRRYREDGFGLWAVVLASTGKMIGQCGLTLQDCGGFTGVEVGYLFNRTYWHCGYATEAARACRDHAFERYPSLGAVFSVIRDNNEPSKRVALRNGMTAGRGLIKHYYGMDMPHTVYSVTMAEYDALKAKERQDG